MSEIGKHLRQLREAKGESDYSVYKVAERIGIKPYYLSKIETGKERPSERVLVLLAKDLGVNADVLLALDGKVSARLQAVILKRPVVFAALLDQLENAPDHAILRVVREVRDGNW